MMSRKTKKKTLLLSIIGLCLTACIFVLLFIPQKPTPPPTPPITPTVAIAVCRHKNFKEVHNVPQGTFKYGGSTTWAPIRSEVDKKIQEDVPEFKLEILNPKSVNPGSDTGIKQLLGLLAGEERLTFAQSSRPFTGKEYETAYNQGFLLKQIPVAIDGIVVAVNPKLNIPGLTVDKLGEIYRGTITNWIGVGGPNLSIKPYSRRQDVGGTVKFFVERVLKNSDFSKTVQYENNTTTALRLVESDIASIYYASAPEVVEQCGIKALPLGYQFDQLVSPYKEPLLPAKDCSKDRHNQVNVEVFRNKRYPLTRKLYVIVKQDHPDQQAGEAYANLLMSQQGQELLQKTGFVTIGCF